MGFAFGHYRGVVRFFDFKSSDDRRVYDYVDVGVILDFVWLFRNSGILQFEKNVGRIKKIPVKNGDFFAFY